MSVIVVFLRPLGLRLLATILETFHSGYEKEYTYRLNAPAELVCYHVVAIAEVDKLTPQKKTGTGRKLNEAVKGIRDVDFIEAGIQASAIYNGDLLEPGMSFTGPAIIEEAGTTIVIHPGMPCKIDDYGNYCIQTHS